MDIARALTFGRPAADWDLNGNTYAGLVWKGPGNKPTQAQIKTMWDNYLKARGHRGPRKREYIKNLSDGEAAFEDAILDMLDALQEEVRDLRQSVGGNPVKSFKDKTQKIDKIKRDHPEG